MTIHNPDALEVKDEGATQGRVRIFDFVGTGVVAAVSGQTATVTIAGGGADGPPGVMGPPGSTGEDGNDGASFPGPAGADGAPGPTGVAGAAGPPGWSGDDGADGFPMPGPAGAAGANGAAGAAGLMGPPGMDGEDGDPGPMGPVGPTGPQGPAGGGGGSFTPVIVEKDLGSLPRYSGTFDITGLSGLTPGNHVYIQQAAGPYTGKGDRQDEAEMDQAIVTGYVVDANTIRSYWTCQPKNGPLVGNVKWGYVPGA